MSNAEVIDICSMIFERGILNLKLYMMVGLPSETEDDLNKIKSLGMAVREKMMDKTLADSYPCSDAPSTMPDPGADDSMTHR